MGFVELISTCLDPKKSASDLLQLVDRSILREAHSFGMLSRDLYDFCRGRGGYSGKIGLQQGPLPAMKVAYIGKLLAECHEKVNLQGCRESIQLRALMLNIRTTLLSAGLQFPPPVSCGDMVRAPGSA